MSLYIWMYLYIVLWDYHIFFQFFLLVICLLSVWHLIYDIKWIYMLKAKKILPKENANISFTNSSRHFVFYCFDESDVAPGSSQTWKQRLFPSEWWQMGGRSWVPESSGSVAAVQCSITNPCFQEKKGPHYLNLCNAKPSLILTEIANEGRMSVQRTS